MTRYRLLLVLALWLPVMLLVSPPGARAAQAPPAAGIPPLVGHQAPARLTEKSSRSLAHRPANTGAVGGESTPLNLPPYAPAGPSSATADNGLLGLAAKFAVVLALLFLCLRGLRVLLPHLSPASRVSDTSLVLASETIGDKQRVCLLDLGTRIVVVGVAGTTMVSLATVDDAEEAATLRARYRAIPQPARLATALRQEGSPIEKPASFARVFAHAIGQLAPTSRPTGRHSVGRGSLAGSLASRKGRAVAPADVEAARPGASAREVATPAQEPRAVPRPRSHDQTRDLALEGALDLVRKLRQGAEQGPSQSVPWADHLEYRGEQRREGRQ